MKWRTFEWDRYQDQNGSCKQEVLKYLWQFTMEVIRHLQFYESFENYPNDLKFFTYVYIGTIYLP